ncbi:hypothetical protein QW131_25780 [Roseibium salinum]|nr:hypothetical protein [Roseibium salinum]
MKAACDTAGVSDSPRGLGELLSAAGWKRCEPVLSAAFSGVPAEVRGRITFRSGAPFCRHVMCTSLPLAGDLQAVLVQFDMAETVPATGAGPSRRAPPKRPALPAELLEHFPDDIVIFDGCESAEEKGSHAA